MKYHSDELNQVTDAMREVVRTYGPEMRKLAAANLRAVNDATAAWEAAMDGAVALEEILFPTRPKRHYEIDPDWDPLSD